jgi:hypothetical protein
MAYDSSRAFINAFPVTPSDMEIQTAFGFYVGGGGNVTVMPSAQEDVAQNGGTAVPVTFEACPVGFVIRDFVISRFMSTGTTATDIVAFGPK